MTKKTSLPIAIAVIIILSLALAILLDMGISFLEKRAHPLEYSEYVEQYSSEYNIPEYIVYAIIKVESDFDPKAMSSSGALRFSIFIMSAIVFPFGGVYHSHRFIIPNYCRKIKCFRRYLEQRRKFYSVIDRKSVLW